MTTVAQEGRRFYLLGLPFEAKELAKSLGCKFDWERKCWWTGTRSVAEQVAGSVNATSSDSEPKSSPSSDRPAPGRSQVVAGKVLYKGRAYYLAGRVNRGRTHYDDRVDAITTRDGAKCLLCFRDGSKSFWAARSECQVVKSYSRPQTIGELIDFAAKAKAAGGVDAYLTKRAHESGRCRDCGTQLETWHDGFHAGLCHDCV